MLAEHLSRKADSLIRSKRSIGVNIQSQLIVIGNLSHTGVLDGHIDTLNRGVDGIYRDHADRKILALILVSAHIATALGDRQLHVEATIRTATQCCDDLIRVHDLDVRVSLNISSSDHALALMLNVCGLDFVAVAVILNR